MARNISLLRMRSEIAAGTRGASLGIGALEIAAINRGSHFFINHQQIDLNDQNQSLHESIDTPNAIRTLHLEKVLEELMNGVANTLLESKFPLVLSGDHSNAAGTIAGIKRAFPDKKLGVIWVDAHGDLHTPYTTPSGNMHGMPVAISLGMDNESRAINQLSEKEKASWDRLKNLGDQKPKIDPENVVFFAVRDTEAPEDGLMEEYGIKNYSVAELRFRGLDTCLKEASEKLAECDMLYISFDVDSMDCNLISKGTGTPVEKGLDQTEATYILKHFLADERTVSFEMVEINPLLDEKGNKMAETAFEILESLF